MHYCHNINFFVLPGFELLTKAYRVNRSVDFVDNLKGSCGSVYIFVFF